MTSSTSSSKGGLIFRSALVFAFLMIVYNIGLMAFKPRIAGYQNQWDKNISVVEDYILEDRPFDIIIVGSSLSVRLEADELGSRFLNMGLSRGSAATGLEIIRHADSNPGTVLVEVNYLAELDSGFVRERFHPVTRFLRKYVPSSRVRLNPVNLMLGILKGNRKRKHEPAPDSSTFAGLLAIHKKGYDKLPDTAALGSAIKRISETVEALSARNINVVFFQMPVHPSLESSIWMRTSRKAFQNAFPPSRFLWLDDIPGEYETVDGIHLMIQSARHFSHALKIQAESRIAQTDP